MIPKYILRLVLGLYSLSMSELVLASNNTQHREVFLYSHVHYYMEEDRADDFDEEIFVNQIIAKKTFLISPSYAVIGSKYRQDKKFDSYIQKYPHLFSDSEIARRDMKTIEFIRKYPNKFIGLCGLNLMWDNFADKIDLCLKSKEMVGLKIHSLTSLPMSPNEIKSKISELTEYLKDKPTVILWHLDFEYWGMQEDEAIQYFLQVVDSNRNIQWIIAHGYEDLDDRGHTLAKIRKTEQKFYFQKIENLWFEPSTSYMNGAHLFSQSTLDYFRFFGLERMLFGTDSLMKKRQEVGEQSNLLRTIKNTQNKILEHEQEKILRINAQRLFNALGLLDSKLKVENSKVSEIENIRKIFINFELKKTDLDSIKLLSPIENYYIEQRTHTPAISINSRSIPDGDHGGIDIFPIDKQEKIVIQSPVDGYLYINPDENDVVDYYKQVYIYDKASSVIVKMVHFVPDDSIKPGVFHEVNKGDNLGTLANGASLFLRQNKLDIRHIHLELISIYESSFLPAEKFLESYSDTVNPTIEEVKIFSSLTKNERDIIILAYDSDNLGFANFGIDQIEIKLEDSSGNEIVYFKSCPLSSNILFEKGLSGDVLNIPLSIKYTSSVQVSSKDGPSFRSSVFNSKRKFYYSFNSLVKQARVVSCGGEYRGKEFSSLKLDGILLNLIVTDIFQNKALMKKSIYSH